MLESPPASLTREQNVPVEKVAAALDSAIYRLIRSSADLQAALLEELLKIGKDAKHHLSMLYYTIKQQKKKKKKKKRRKDSKAKTVRKRLDEEALQSYIHCRLNDRLPGRVLDSGATAIFLDRETLGTKNQRLDIKVQAPTIEGPAATVVIEIKWSDNREISTSLVEQLGERYLVGPGLTHGIYLVGWCGPGTWSRNATGEKPENRGAPNSWENAFREQARLFTEDHHGIFIEPLVLDLVWDQPK